MIPVPSAYPPGTVVVVSGELTRFADFAVSLARLCVPEGTKLIWSQGNLIARNRNNAVRERKGEWVWCLDDDHTFGSDIVFSLLAREVPIVFPLTCTRSADSQPVIFTGQRLWTWQDLPPEGGLLPVDGGAAAGMLIRSEVFEALRDPWFEVGRLHPELFSEDLYFQRKAKEVGFQTYVDLDEIMPHIWQCLIVPDRDPWRASVGLRV